MRDGDPMATFDRELPTEAPATTAVEAGRLIDWLATGADPDEAVQTLRYLHGLASQALHHAQGRQAEAWRAADAAATN